MNDLPFSASQYWASLSYKRGRTSLHANEALLFRPPRRVAMMDAVSHEQTTEHTVRLVQINTKE